MAKTPLTPEEKAKKKQRDNLKIIHNRVLSAYSFRQVKTWRDVYSHLGYSPEHINTLGTPEKLNSDVKYQELQVYFEEQKQELERKLEGEHKPVIVEQKVAVPTPSGEAEKQMGITRIEEALGEKEEIPWKELTNKENNDCSVTALSFARDIPYDKAKDELVREGRKYGEGMRVDWLSEYLLASGFQLVEGEVGKSLSEVIKDCGTGRYLVRTRDHAFAIIDGVVFDYFKPQPDLRIERIYKFVGVKEEKKPEEKKEEKGELFDASNDYGLIPSPHERAFLYWFQKKAIAEMFHKITVERKRGLLLLSTTGSGKTFMVLGLDRRLIDTEYHEGKTWSHIPRLYITKATVVEQTKRVAKRFFNIAPNVDTEIINIEQLRASAGQLWVQEKVRIENGEEVHYWEWKKNINPCVVYFDESQGAKNKGSKQSQIIYAYNNLPANTCLVSISATPFTRVSEAQAFAVSTHRPLDHLNFPAGTVLTNENWPSYASIIASPSKPDEYNQAAIERLMEDLKDYVVRVRGIRPQFDAQNGVKIIDFETDEDRIYYATAWDRFLKEMAKLKILEEEGDASTGTCRLVILLKFAMAAEFCHARHFARRMYEAWKNGKAPVAAVKFKGTLIQIVKILNEEYGVSRDNISLIWGGGQTALTKKQKAKKKIKDLREKFEKMGLDVEEMLGDMGLDEVEDREPVDLPAHLRLGMQKPEDRQTEIDNFNSGKSQFAIYTLKAGGVGLSLHHTDEFISEETKNQALRFLRSKEDDKELSTLLADYKKGDCEAIKKRWNSHGDKIKAEYRPAVVRLLGCRRKESGYAVEEDIPHVPVRPRETFVVVTYNAIELVQGVGRVPRLTSLSPTIQNVYCFAGTVEVDMGRIYSQKLRCLSSVVKMRESWQDVIFGGSSRQRIVDEAINKTKDVVPDESATMIDEGDVEEEEENGNGD